MTSTDLIDRALPDRIASFPFPFPTDRYRYSTNVEPAGATHETAAGSWGEHVLHVDEYYGSDSAECAALLAADPARLQELPHMRPACWDAMLYVMGELQRARPDAFTLDHLGGDRWHWRNRLLGIEQEFVLGDEATLPTDPLRFTAPQVQDDLVLLDQREGSLWADAGVVTAAADWSMRFDVGMSFPEIHGPVPRVHPAGVVNRAHQFLMRLQPGEVYRRTNWTMTVGRRLDTATETYPEWGPDRRLVLQEDLGARLHLRVEVQHLVRLPGSGAVLFLIRTYLLPLEDVARVPAWRDRFAAVLEELPEDMADYKGLTRYREAAVAWLRSAA
ncbi:heme-dependent oxidative N-demethylase family protein [Geodermatophilus sp. SYSU D00705]